MNTILEGAPAIKQLLTRDNIKRAFSLGYYALIALSILLLFLIFTLLMSNVFSIGGDIAKQENELKKKLTQLEGGLSISKEKRDYEQISKRSPFGDLSATQVKTSTKKKIEKPISDVALELIGTFITPGEAPHAIIEDSKKRDQESFEIGDNIFDTAELVAIFSDKVEIKRNGKIEILKLDDTAVSGSDDEESDNVVTVAENELDNALSNLPLLLTQARAVPYFKNGKSVGLRLFAIKRGSLYEKIGLKNGDILKTINGNNLGDITQAVKLFEKLRDERSIRLELERNRILQTINYRIQ